MNTDHIVHNAVTQRMECKHCGFYGAVKMPDTIDSILAQFDVFMEAHKGCQPPVFNPSPVYKPPSEAVMSEYIAGFDAGCDFILREIERWQDEVGEDLHVLLAHLRMESKQGRENT
jgi:hypothetical protein